MCGFSCSVWPSDPKFTWLKFHLHIHTHTYTAYSLLTHALLLLLSPCSEIEPTPLKNCNNTCEPPQLTDKKDKWQQTTLIESLTIEAVDPLLSYHEFSVGAPAFPYLAVLRCAQQAAQLGPRCGSHVIRSWEAEDKRPMVGLFLGLGSVLQWFNYMLWSVRSELWQPMSCLMPHFPKTAQ